MRSSNDSDHTPAVHRRQTIEIKTGAELDKLRQSGRLVSGVLRLVSGHIHPGVSTRELDELANRELRSLGARPAFLGYRGFPATACVSINEELVHGIPSGERIIRDGDIVTIDLGLVYDGFYGDVAATYGAGSISPEAGRLIDITREALNRAIEQVHPSRRLGDVSWAVQQYAEQAGFSVVRDYVGHGIGRQLHEDPPIPNFGRQGTGTRLSPGIVLAIEPMVNAGDFRVKTLSDGWTVVTEDGRLCAHFEHMVSVTEDGHEVLTSH